MKFNFIFLVQFIFLFFACKKESSIINDTGRTYAYGIIKSESAIQIREIYHTSNFAAFTDLAYYNNLWYAVFRVGTGHSQGENGVIKILISTDGNVWKVLNELAVRKIDLRDPKLTIDSANNALYLNFFGRNVLKNGAIDIINYITKLDTNANAWTKTKEISYQNTSNNKFIFWRLTYYRGKMYSIAYRTPLLSDDTKNLSLFVSDNSFSNYKLVNKIDLGGNASETTLRFIGKDSMYLLARTESINSPIGISLPDYKKITWITNPLFAILSAPNFLCYKNKLLISARNSKNHTCMFFCYDLKSKKVQKTYIFPSGYETGYSGMSFNPNNTDELWISYYSIDNTGSSIKLAKINLLRFLN